MATLHPFRALRPAPAAAPAVAAVPYDVINADEARTLAAGKPLSFLHVSRAELGLPASTDPYSDVVYDTAQAELRSAEVRGAARRGRRAERVFLSAANGLARADGPGGVLLARRIRRRRHPEAREDAEGQGRRPHASHARTRRPDRTGVPDVSRRRPRSTRSPRQQRRGRRSTTSRPRTACSTRSGACPETPRRPSLRRWAACRGSISPTATIARRRPPATRAELRRRGVSRPEADTFLAVAFPHDQVQILAYNRLVKDLDGISVPAS